MREPRELKDAPSGTPRHTRAWVTMRRHSERSGTFACALVAALCSSVGCSSREPAAKRAGLTTNTDSTTLADRAARLAFLERYVKLKTPLADAAFVIRYQDNSTGGLPGPSDWDIRVVLVAEGSGAAWYAGWTPCPEAGATTLPAWASELLARRPEWKSANAGARCFRDPQHPSSTIYAFASDHLLAYRNASEATP